MCVAVNSAGEAKALAAVRVKGQQLKYLKICPYCIWNDYKDFLSFPVPPRVLRTQGNLAVTLAQRIMLHCPIEGGDPPPIIVWMKNNRPVEPSSRVQQLNNGSLVIFDSEVRKLICPLPICSLIW